MSGAAVTGTVPMKMESLSGLDAVKVECGSQFSVCLTRSGAVFTLSKGDYHRLGPRKVAALHGRRDIM